ncbi:MAG TPA: hypothetical protein VJ803_09035 [Gemmatimonadaceae bacterium]|nr:hypothetical protein [Gemmatimonadaceae bacterium]
MADRRQARRASPHAKRAKGESTRRVERGVATDRGAESTERERKRLTSSRRGAKRATRGKVGREPGTPVRLMRIRALDPHAACGPGTTVMQLYRVDDLPTDSAVTHLVFFDRHGWYCEHGRDCPAVAAVRKHIKQTI